MDVPHDLAQRVPPSGLLGYLNFSDGRPDPRFQRSLNEAWAALTAAGDHTPWDTLRAWLLREADTLQAAGSAAFRDLAQARAVVTLALDKVLRAYRDHHADLLAHQADATLFVPFFLARVCEAVLQQGGPWDDETRLLTRTLHRLNDYVGHRPVAILETRPQTELYPHERVRPVPIYLRGVGPGYGPYQQIVDEAVEVLRQTDPDLRAEAHFDLELMDELAFDPRGYDHAHPANRRPNYLFGEWDPHVIDGQGRYRRFVVRQVVLDALVAVPSQPHPEPGTANANLLQSAAVLAGTVLMASGVSGDGPTAHSSDTRLGDLVPRITRYRDAFYARLLERIPGAEGDRLREEAKRLRQPFGGIRQHLNQELARQRAAQLQDRHLALVFAELGYPQASRNQAVRIPTASVRMLAETRLRQTAAELALRRGQRAQAAALLPEVEDLVERGIHCGALADPWNILGYQGLYPLFQSREDSVREPRNDDLIETLSRQFDLYARLLASAASAGDEPLRKELARSVRRLAGWWDRFATYEVSDVPRLRGEEHADAALHVAQTLAKYRSEFPVSGSEPAASAERGTRSTELQFWRSQREGFTSPAAFAQVIEALLRNQDWRAALALLMTWLSEAESVPLADGEASFHRLAPRWLAGVLASLAGEDRAGLVLRCFELIEANAEAFWSVPTLPGAVEPAPPEDEEDPFASAYEGMTYRDSTDDGEEGSVIGGAGGPGEFPLQEHAKRVEEGLEFLKTVARLWDAAARPDVWASGGRDGAGAPAEWQQTARAWQVDLLALLDHLYQIPIPAPSGGSDDVIEFEKRRHVKDGLIDATIAACVEAGRAARALAALRPADGGDARTTDPGWEPVAVALERAIRQRDPAAVRDGLPRLLERLAGEPLLFVPTSEGGRPRPIVRAKSTLVLFADLFGRLPRLGLIRETYHLVKLARTMEQNGPVEGRKVSEFDQLFRTALRAVVEALLAAAERSDREAAQAGPAPPEGPAAAGRPQPPATKFTTVLRKIADSFLKLWVVHSNTLRLSALEGVGDRDTWDELRHFIRAYGRGLFTASFMTYANLRGILHRGVGTWLDSLAELDATARPEALLDDLGGGKLRRDRVIFFLEVVLHAVTENYEEYKDYNTTTTQSDYGENLHVLLDFLRLKVSHDRFAWRMQPLVLAHEVLCRNGYGDLAEHWRKSISDSSKDLTDRLLVDLAALETEQAVRLRTVRERIEGGFAAPLRVDWLCALAEPAARAARAGQDESAEPFQQLAEQIRPFTESPSGVGLDAPAWLRRLEADVARLREGNGESRSELPLAVDGLTLVDLQRQLAEWDKPLTGE